MAKKDSIYFADVSTFIGRTYFCSKKKKAHKMYNANTEKDQLISINELSEMLKAFNNISVKRVCLVGYFNLYFDPLLESQGENPILKKDLVPKRLSLKIPFNFAIFGGLKIPK